MKDAELEAEFSSLFAPEPDSVEQPANAAVWKILLVDDEPDILSLFRLSLMNITVEGRPLKLFEAGSAEMARMTLLQHPDIALILLDVVMETEQAGLLLARHIREELNNRLIQIVIVTGQPGYAPQRNVVVDYEINGYRLKTEFTADKIFVTVYAAIRSHHTLLKLLEQKQLLDEAERRAQQDRMLKSFIVESSEDAIIGKALDGSVTSWNRAAEKIFSYTANEMIGHTLEAIIPLDRREEERRVCNAVRKSEGTSLFETERLTKDGNRIDVFLTISPILDFDGQIVGISEIARDITQRKQAELKLRLAANVFTHAREAIIITELDGTIVDVNDAFSRITGYTREEVIGNNPRLLKSGRQSQSFYASMWKSLLEKGHWYGELCNRRKNGEFYYEKMAISAVFDAQGQAQNFVALCADITLIKAHEKRLEHMAHFDVLTSLPNRALLSDRLNHGISQVMRHGLHLAVAYLDLDGFKAVNDRFGHEVGDQVLVTLANRMKQTLRDSDTLCRLGGDEFVAVLIDLADIEDSLPTLNRLLAAASQPVVIGEQIFQVSASVGITFYPQVEEVDADQLMRQADQAMYQAKLAGKNRYHAFDTEQDSRIRVNHENVDRIRQALNSREFVLYYQPKVNLRTGVVVGVEALIRWQHPEKGILPPALFLPAIEDHPLAIELGEWVIESALTQIELWREAGLELPISVNIGARQLQQADFSSRIGALLAAHRDILPSCIEMEVLETSALEDLFQASRIIKDCNANGIQFALDDFGTGYSSLSYLKQLPVRQLKIDQSFVRDMLHDPDDLAILEGIIGLANAFRREVIAEGVETIEHGELLLQLGCELAQGYGIARPMPASDVPDWAATWHPALSWQTHCPVSQENFPLLHAGVELRAWINGIENYLNDTHVSQPDSSMFDGQFFEWLKCRGVMDKHPALIAEMYRNVDQLAMELCELHGQGCQQEALSRLKELHQLRDQLLDQLKSLLQQVNC